MWPLSTPFRVTDLCFPFEAPAAQAAFESGDWSGLESGLEAMDVWEQAAFLSWASAHPLANPLVDAYGKTGREARGLQALVVGTYLAEAALAAHRGGSMAEHAAQLAEAAHEVNTASIQLNPEHPLPFRNLAVAYAYAPRDPSELQVLSDRMELVSSGFLPGQLDLLARFSRAGGGSDDKATKYGLQCARGSELGRLGTTVLASAHLGTRSFQAGEVDEPTRQILLAAFDKSVERAEGMDGWRSAAFFNAFARLLTGLGDEDRGRRALLGMGARILSPYWAEEKAPKRRLQALRAAHGLPKRPL